MQKKAIDLQPSNLGTKARENERDRESSLEEKAERKVVNRKKLRQKEQETEW